MKNKTSAKTKSGVKASASKKAPAAKKPVAVKAAKKPAISKKTVVEKVVVASVAVEQPHEEQVVKAPVAVETTIAQSPEPTVKKVVKVAKPVEVKPVDPNEVKTRKTTVRTGDIADGDTDKGGRFEVLVGETKIGEVAFCSVVRIRDGEPSGFRRSWRGEDATGKVLFTEGKRMNYVVAQLVAASKGQTIAPEIKREVAATIAAPAEHVNVSQGASA